MVLLSFCFVFFSLSSICLRIFLYIIHMIPEDAALLLHSHWTSKPDHIQNENFFQCKNLLCVFFPIYLFISRSWEKKVLETWLSPRKDCFVLILLWSIHISIHTITLPALSDSIHWLVFNKTDDPIINFCCFSFSSFLLPLLLPSLSHPLPAIPHPSLPFFPFPFSWSNQILQSSNFSWST